MPAFVRYLTPLILFLALATLLYAGLSRDPRVVPSPLVGKAAPDFSLPSLQDPQQQIALEDFRGQVTLLNVWATWCSACRAEHPLLVRLAEQGVRIYGLNYKDNRDDALRLLQQSGDPYIANAFDEAGRVAIDWGVYGAPETFVIDKQGIIRYKHIGPVTVEAINNTLMPLIKELQETPG